MSYMLSMRALFISLPSALSVECLARELISVNEPKLKVFTNLGCSVPAKGLTRENDRNVTSQDRCLANTGNMAFHTARHAQQQG
eukprot:gene32681-17696_t